MALQPQTAEETITRLRAASGTLEAQLAIARLELPDRAASSGKNVATLRRELAAFNNALDVASTWGNADLTGDTAALMDQKRDFDMEYHL